MMNSGDSFGKLKFVVKASGLFFLSVTFAMQLLAWADAKDDYSIVSPTTAEPESSGPGDSLQIVVRLRLPLTPPPGVQQPRALKGWRVRFASRNAVTADGNRGEVIYPSHLIRIRPVKGDLYRISAELVPWMLPGKYDLIVEGPGLSARQSRAVIVGQTPDLGDVGVEIARVDKSSVLIKNLLSEPAKVSLEIIVPAGVPGLAVEVDKKRVDPAGVAWAFPPEAGRIESRVLRFEVEVPGASEEKPGESGVRWKRVEARPCEASIEVLGENKGIDPMSCTDLSLELRGFKPFLVIWDFGDGAWAVGERAQHRFFITENAEPGAAAFDNFGRVCRASLIERLVLPVERSGCSCQFVGAK